MASTSSASLPKSIGLTQPLTSKHLEVLRDAGFVTRPGGGPRRWYSLRVEPLVELDDWLTPYRWMWESHLDRARRPPRRDAGRRPNHDEGDTRCPLTSSSHSTGRPTVRVERRYPHPIDKVWRAVTTPEHLGQWFPSPVEVDLRPGGAMTLQRVRGKARARPERSRRSTHRDWLTFTWGTDRLTFELTPDGDGTTFALTHSFDDRSGAPSFATGWEVCLDRASLRARRRAAAAARPWHRPARGAGPRVRPRPAGGHGDRRTVGRCDSNAS